MKLLLRLFGAIGLLLFGALFALTFVSPLQIEKAARNFIQAEVEAQVKERLATLRDEHPVLAKAAGLLAKRYEEQIAALRGRLAQSVKTTVAKVVTQMQDPDCSCRRWLQEKLKIEIATLDAARKKLVELAQGKYVEVVQQLLRDLRIFTGSNAVVFLLLLLISFTKPAAALQLLVPGTLLLLATLLASYFYLFQQDWFFNIVHNQHVGFGYLAWIGMLFALFADVLLNRARVTTEVVNGVLDLLGSATQAVPC